MRKTAASAAKEKKEPADVALNVMITQSLRDRLDVYIHKHRKDRPRPYLASVVRAALDAFLPAGGE